MKHLGISGGGTKIAGLFSAAEEIILNKGYKPDIISGISAGAVLSVPLALGKYDIMRKKLLNFNLNTFFSVKPVNENGKIDIPNAVFRITTEKRSLGVQDNLDKVIKEVVPKKEFEDYQNNDGYPICIVGSIDFYTAARVYINLKDKSISYEDYIAFVKASASLPVFTEGVLMDKPFKDFLGNQFKDEVLLYDGGVRDHSPSGTILENDGIFKEKITETCTIFSRPLKHNLTSDVDKRENLKTDMISVLMQYIEVTNVEISKTDEFCESIIAKEKGITNHGPICLPSIMTSFYDVNKARILQLYNEAKIAVQQQWDTNQSSGLKCNPFLEAMLLRLE